jgi:hypothetical protein
MLYASYHGNIPRLRKCDPAHRLTQRHRPISPHPTPPPTLLLQARLQEALAKTSIQELEASLQSASQAYVNATNTKPIFLDVVIEDDYNPLAPLDRTIRIPTADLDDPLLHDLVKTHTEKNLLQTGISSRGGPASSNGSRAGSSSSRSRPGQLSSRSGANGSSSGSNGSSSATQFGLAKATTRPMLETQRWAAGQIHATPYGHCIDDKTANYIVRWVGHVQCAGGCCDMSP